jgi:hypothetical protein
MAEAIRAVSCHRSEDTVQVNKSRVVRLLIVCVSFLFALNGCSSRNRDSKSSHERELIMAIHLGTEWQERGWEKTEDETGFHTIRVFSSENEAAWTDLVEKIRVTRDLNPGLGDFKSEVTRSGLRNRYEIFVEQCFVSIFTFPSPVEPPSEEPFPLVPLEKIRVSVIARCPRHT